MASVNYSAFNALTTADEVVSAWPERVTGRTFAITGPSPGSLGWTFITALAKAHPASLILVGRSNSKLTEARAAVHAIDPEIYVLEVVVDISSIASVREGATAILTDARIRHIDVLVNNAAIMAGPYEKSVDGVELQFATAHIGHFLLTAILADRLRASPEGGRVVNVTSGGFRKLNFDRAEDYDPLFEHHEYDQWDAYGSAKLANIVFTKGLVDRGFTSYSVNPGWILTSIGARIHYDFESSAVVFAKVPDLEPVTVKTLDQGPNSHLVAALRPADSLPNGAYLFECQVGNPSQLAKDEDGLLLRKLWEVSERLVGLTF